MGLSIGLLGPLVIESEESGLGKIPKKARALLAYLAAQGGQAVSRERLADLLWPYQGSEQARHSLRNCLLELRKALRPEAAQYLVCDFAHCRLRDVAVDLDRFERSAREPQRCELQTAADLYRGEFLADFHIDSEPFQEWLAAERDRALALVCEVLQRLTATAEPGESEAAIQSGRRLVALDSLSEYGQRALMRAYARAGRRGEALRQYKSCAEILKRELGVAPDAETQALAAEIARPGGAEEAHGAGRGGTANGPAETAGSREQPPHPTIGPPAAPSPGTMRLAWPCLLSNIAVAVAPLRNLTGDPEQQYLVEAFTDDLVTDLLRHSRGLSLKPITNARGVSGGLPREPENGLEFVVTGSAQRSTPGMLRVNMRITDAATTEYLWAGRHEFRPEELAPIQTKITRRISRELHVLALQEASRRAALATGPELGINECLTRAKSALSGAHRAEHTAEGQRWFLAALAQDPRNTEALVGLARTCQQLVSNPWWGDPRAAAAADLGREAVAIALALAPGHAFAKCTQGMLYSAAGQLEEAARAFEQALAMDHGLGIAHGFAGYNAALLGRAGETLPAIERAMALDPTERRHSIWFFFGGFAELLLGRTQTAIDLLHQSLQRNPSYGATQLFLAAGQALAGRPDEAARTAETFRIQYPEYPANAFHQLWLSRSPSAAYRAQIQPLFEKIRDLGVAT
ncbi:MAG TPA: BTAD domain-containing putative transcriptional regulator [Stellaceae bacterium]|nr:BTAD domain-containing putative transcriptional regulator [Stellaceae bacterium]